MTLLEYISEKQSWMNKHLLDTIEKQKIPEHLKNSMIYSVEAGGKRLRPILLMATYEAFRPLSEHVIPAACAIEMIHTYSLIHDDLPAMDDDDFRRGKPDQS